MKATSRWLTQTIYRGSVPPSTAAALERALRATSGSGWALEGERCRTNVLNVRGQTRSTCSTPVNIATSGLRTSFGAEAGPESAIRTRQLLGEYLRPQLAGAGHAGFVEDRLDVVVDGVQGDGQLRCD